MTSKVRNKVLLTLYLVVAVLCSRPVMVMAGSVVASGNLNRSFRVEHLTTEDGLSQNTIVSILKDSRGFMD